MGGRTYDVLLWRAPRHFLHETLEQARLRYPASKTLGDFRSSARLAEAEQIALERRTPDCDSPSPLAGLYPEKTTLRDWMQPAAPTRNKPGRHIAFLGPTLGRRGAYLVRGAMKKLGLPFVIIGRNLEDPHFWQGLRVWERSFGPDWLEGVGLLLAPALTEFKPRMVLAALRLGVPVIATEACGLPAMPHLHLTDPYNEDALAEKIDALRPR